MTNLWCCTYHLQAEISKRVVANGCPFTDQKIPGIFWMHINCMTIKWLLQLRNEDRLDRFPCNYAAIPLLSSEMWANLSKIQPLTITIEAPNFDKDGKCQEFHISLLPKKRRNDTETIACRSLVCVVDISPQIWLVLWHFFQFYRQQKMKMQRNILSSVHFSLDFWEAIHLPSQM